MQFKSPLGTGLCPCSLPIGTRERGADGRLWEVVHHPSARVRIWVREADPHEDSDASADGRHRHFSDLDHRGRDLDHRGRGGGGGLRNHDEWYGPRETEQESPQRSRRYTYAIQQIVDAYREGTTADALRVLANVAETIGDRDKLARHLRAYSQELVGRRDRGTVEFLRAAAAMFVRVRE